jgi:peptidoglycan/LPS O-acetylase OafA/YrhL
MIGLENAKSLHILFTNRFSQYLGKISYSFYLTHGWIIKVFSWKFATLILPYLGDTLAVIVAFIATTVVLFCVADVVNRMVDENVVRFTNGCITRHQRIVTALPSGTGSWKREIELSRGKICICLST